MSVAILGRGTFEDLYSPLKGKSEWGMDTLTRRVSGARALAEAYIAGLTQGDFRQGYYLQTWEPDDNPNVATITLNYKGLLTGGTPVPDIETEIVTTTGTTTNDYSTENDGAGRLYGKQVIAQILDTVPGGFGTTAEFIKNGYAVGATMQFNYKAIQARIRYINVGEPSGPQYTAIGVHFDPSFDNARIVTSDGATFGIDRMTFFELEPQQLPPRIISFNSKHVIGTPWWEAEEILRLELGTPN